MSPDGHGRAAAFPAVTSATGTTEVSGCPYDQRGNRSNLRSAIIPSCQRKHRLQKLGRISRYCFRRKLDERAGSSRQTGSEEGVNVLPCQQGGCCRGLKRQAKPQSRKKGGAALLGRGWGRKPLEEADASYAGIGRPQRRPRVFATKNKSAERLHWWRHAAAASLLLVSSCNLLRLREDRGREPQGCSCWRRKLRGREVAGRAQEARYTRSKRSKREFLKRKRRKA